MDEHPEVSPELLGDETVETLGPYTFIQKRKGHRATGDSLLLVDFLLPLAASDIVVDLGTGTGLIPLVLAWKSPVKTIVGVEAEPGAAGAARRNIRMNGLEERITVVERDWREVSDLYPEGSFSVVVSNPPYTKRGAGRVSPVRERAVGRSEILGTVEDFLSACWYLAGPEGRICFVYPTARLDEIKGMLIKTGLRAVRTEFIEMGGGRSTRKRTGSVPKALKVFLMEARRA